MFKQTPAGLLILLLPLAGCGAPAPAQPHRQTTRPPVQNRLPPNMIPRGMEQPGMLDGQPAGNPQELQRLLAGVRQMQTALPGFVGTIETYDKGPGGAESQTLKVAFRKPSTLRFTVVKAAGNAQGTQALYTGGSDVKIKPSFLPMAMNLSVNDARIKSKNGWTIRETDVAALLKVLLDPQSQVRLIGDQPVEGKMLAMLEVRGPGLPNGASHEMIGIDRQQNMPTVRMIFKGAQLAYKLTIKSIQIKSPASSELEL